MALATTNTQTPVRYIDDNIVVSDTHVWTYMQLPVEPYEFLAYDKRKDIAERIFLSLAGLVTGTTTVDVHLSVVHRPTPVDEWEKALRARVSGWSPAPGWDEYISQMSDYLSSQEFLQKEVYLGVCLGRRNASAGSLLSDVMAPFKKLISAAEKALDYEDYVIADKDLQKWTADAEDVRLALAGSHMRAEPIDANTVARLIRQHMYPGDADSPPITSLPGMPWGPGDVQTLTDALIVNGHKSLQVTQTDDDGIETTSHVATLAMSRFPDQMTFPNQEPWIHFMSSLAFPVDFTSRLTLVPALQVKKDVGRKLAGVKDQTSHIMQAGSAVPLDLLEQYERATALEYTINKDRIPWAYGRHYLRVHAASKDELRSRVKRIIDHYRDLAIDITWPSGDQLALFREAMPGDKVRCTAYYQRQELMLVAGGMPTASAEVGDHIDGPRGWVGPYIGETTSRVRTRVNFSPHVAPTRNRPPGIAITGAPGGGKALATSTRIPTPDGWTTMGDLQVGDTVFDENGQPCKVAAVYDQPDDRPANEVLFDDGSTIIADDDHLWLVDSRERATHGSLPARPLSRRSQRRLQQFLTTSDADEAASLEVVRAMIGSGIHRQWFAAAADHLQRRGYKPHEVRPSHPVMTRRPVFTYRAGTIAQAILDLLDAPTAIGGPATQSPVLTTSELRATLTTSEGFANHSIATFTHLHSDRPDTDGLYETALGALSAGTPVDSALLRGSLSDREAIWDAYIDLFADRDTRAGHTLKMTGLPDVLLEQAHDVAITLGAKVFRSSETGTLTVTRPQRDGVRSRRRIVDIRAVESVPMRCISVTSHSRLFLAGEAMIATHNSFLAFTLAYQMAVQGVWTIYIDPKADAKPMASIPGLGSPRMFDLRDGHEGMLDPFSLADDSASATLQALETLRLLIGGNLSEAREEALMQAIQTVTAEPDPSLSKVVETLKAGNTETARNLGMMLGTIQQMPFARLCFSPRKAVQIRPQDGLTVITLLGLDLPNAEMKPTDYSYENKLAVAVMYLLTRFARGLMLSMDKAHPKAICIDEAWAVTSTPQGAKLVPEVARMGRSHNTVLALVSQNAGDLMQDSVTNSISTMFAFRSDRSGEVNDILDLLNMDKTEGHARAIRDLRNGECLMKDIDGRIARVQIDAWHGLLFDAFNTNPETRGKGREEAS